MQNWKARLGTLGEVEMLDYFYMREGRKRPDPLPQLVAAHRQALRDARERHPSRSTILIGKSMGGRIGCHVSLEEKVDDLVCLGYPLCAIGDRTKFRDEVLRALKRRSCCAGQARFALPLELLEQVREE
jgi:predicted alpha/beta-hydrolase family hydrolase